MRLTFLSGLCLFLMACGVSPAPQPEDRLKPMRIVSLDYCADQFVLKLADREQILAVSPDAGKDFSYMRTEAAGLPTVRPLAENVLILKPDLVVRSYGGGPNAAAFFERAGVPVLNVGWASRIDGDRPGSISFVIEAMADGLGQSERGRALAASFRAGLAALETSESRGRALYMPPSGVTSGPGSMIHDMLISTGYENFQTRSGWSAIDLERLAYDQPDVILAARFSASSSGQDAWSPMKHPVARTQLSGQKVIPIEGAWTACGSWFILDAMQALAGGAPE